MTKNKRRKKFAREDGEQLDGVWLTPALRYNFYLSKDLFFFLLNINFEYKRDVWDDYQRRPQSVFSIYT